MSDDAVVRRVLGDDPVDPHDLDAYRRILEVASALGDEDRRPPAPPESMWAAIVAATGSGADASPAPVGAEPAPGATVIPLARSGRRPGRSWLLGAAAAAIAVLGGVVGFAVGSIDRTTPSTVLAAAELEVLDDLAGPGEARLVSRDGELVLELDAASLAPTDGFYQVWLLTPEVDGLVSLGPVRSDGRYAVPSGVDPARFSVVDVSLEPHDGDPAHSGHSVLRGGLV